MEAEALAREFVVHCKRDDFDVYVGRPSPFGNPFSHKPSAHAKYRVKTRDEAIDRFEAWLKTQPELVAKIKRELRGKVLGCHCRPQRCHAEVLARIANEGLVEAPIEVVKGYDPRKAGAACSECPRKGRKVVPPEAPTKRLQLIVVGEGPGRKEEREGQPFIGPSGRLLNTIFDEVGFDRAHAWVTNAVLCLEGPTQVRMGDGSRMRLNEIVKTRHPGPVMCVDAGGNITSRQIVGWYRSPRAGRQIVSVSFKHARASARGPSRSLMTADHKVMVADGWLEAAACNDALIATGDYAPYGAALDIARGTLLGDASIPARGRYGAGHMDFAHAWDQCGYARWKAKALGARTTRGKPGHGSVQAKLRARTYSSGFFRALREEFYSGGRKRIPRDVVREASDLLIAIWFLDDGYLRDHPVKGLSAEICVAGFSHGDVAFATSCLRKKGFACSFNGRAPFRIRFSAEGARELSSRIARYTPPDMQYKLIACDRGKFAADTFELRKGPFYDRAVVRRVTPQLNATSVYCIDVEETHNFITTGAVVHNCRGEDHDLPLAMACCAPRLGKELAKLPKGVPVLALGATAVKPTIGRAGIEKTRGFVWTAPEVPDQRVEAARKVLTKREAAPEPDKDKIIKARAALRVLQGRKHLEGRIVVPSLHPAYLLRGADSSRPLLVTDIDRVVRWSRKPFPLEDEGPYVETNDPKKVKAILAQMKDVVEVDIETDHADPISCHIDCIGIGDGELSLVINPWRKSLVPIVNAALRRRKVIAHNGKAFDEIACARHGLEFPDLEDTLVAHHSYASHMRQSLAHVGSVYCDLSPWKINFHTGAEEKGVAKFGVKAADLSKYNAADLRVGVRVWQRMQPDLAPEMDVYRRDMAIAGLCQEMQVTGLRMDLSKRDLLSRQMGARAAGLLGEMRKLTRRRSFTPAKLADVRRALFGQFKAPTWLAPPTKTGLPSTAGEMLEALRAQDTRAGQLADYILRWRSANDTRSEYLDNIVVGKDGRVHAGWRAAGPETGRPATRNPNILNTPRLEMTDDAEAALKRFKDDKAARSEYLARMGEAVYELESLIRTVYIAGEGKMFLYFDLSQAEMRFAAYLSGDPMFMKTCEGDVHVGNACILFPKMADVIRADPKGAGKKYRDIAKNAGFAVSYLAEADTVYAYLRSKGFSLSLGDVVAMLERIKMGYTKYYQYVDDNVTFARRHGYLRTFLIKRIRRTGFHPKPTVVANFPIQSGVADVMGERLLEIHAKKPRDVKLVMYAYDAAVYELHPKHLEFMKGLLTETWARPIVVPHNGQSFVQPIDMKEGGRLSDF